MIKKAIAAAALALFSASGFATQTGSEGNLDRSIDLQWGVGGGTATELSYANCVEDGSIPLEHRMWNARFRDLDGFPGVDGVFDYLAGSDIVQSAAGNVLLAGGLYMRVAEDIWEDRIEYGAVGAARYYVFPTERLELGIEGRYYQALNESSYNDLGVTESGLTSEVYVSFRAFDPESSLAGFRVSHIMDVNDVNGGDYTTVGIYRNF
ncbi:hypothetical protein ACNSTU_14550 [Aquisalimonas sp. APHAB1-3]|uniref:hypothetical protein n=1 Tax=Aquisalimonas sp. APHAB1-3 TaxID=3402080 RepID=UPI003AAF8242